ncbi:MAG: LapA family protein, partial [Syntrophales bacterium]
YLIVFISFFAGIIVAGLLGIVERFKQTMTINRLYRKIDDLERRNQSLLKSAPSFDETKTL